MRVLTLILLLAGCEVGNIHAYKDGTCQAYVEGRATYNRSAHENTVTCALTFEKTK